MNEEEQCTVESELLPFFDRETNAKPFLDDKNVISRFKFLLPLTNSDDKTTQTKDEDGDYILDRKGSKERIIILEHSVSTAIKLVGLQIWRAALLLADFVIYSQKIFLDKTVLELGSGVGLTSIVASMFAKQVISTDLDVGNILKLIESNIKRNNGILKSAVHVMGLDFFNTDWCVDLKQKIEETDIVIAADVIYDNDVTEAFIKTITKILSTGHKKTLFLGLEKRYVFTISDLDSVAPCFEHFKSCIENERLTVNKIPIDFPQYFNYERTKELILFRIIS